ncbi:MAG: hypothetical protein LBO65_00280 [Spirochaetaceae bacterium]|jgi:hypothetical protein|nr:hypothetical protein [Spirochaetaceae bacterium]
MKKFSPLFLFTLGLFPVLSLGAEHIAPFTMPSARAGGFGGIHTALGDDFSSIFSNPASFAGIERQFSAAEISLSVYGPIFEILDRTVNSKGAPDISSLPRLQDFGAGFDLGGPIAIGLVDRGFGFGLFNRTVADAVVREKTIYPVLSEEIFMTGGFSFRVLEGDTHLVDLGFLAKAFFRGRLGLSGSVGDLSEITTGAASSPYSTQFGIGLDLGIRYTLMDHLCLALTGYDVYSPALVTRYAEISDRGSGGTQSYATVTPRLALGALYRIQNDFLDRYITGAIVMLDYRDFIDPFSTDPRNPLLNLTLGMEITMMRILRIRAGMADVLPSFGFGLDMHALTLDVAVRGKELGKNPGDNRTFAFDLGLLFRY